MRRVLLIGVSATVLAIAAFWLAGGFDWLALRAAEGQRTFQNAMARGLRALQAGETGAVWTLLGACFAYGFFHAAGPGHGKVLIGGYGLSTRAALSRLAGLAFVSSMAQGASAVLLVAAGITVLGWTREAMTVAAEDWLAPVSYAAIAALGLWLLWRGVGHVRALRATRDHAHHGHGAVCDTCGHAHAPTLEEVSGMRGWRDAVAIVAAIAIRPCTGAIFLLILCWRFGIFGIGIAGTAAMALGVTVVTIFVAVASVGMREGALASVASDSRARIVAPTLEIAAGLIVTVIASNLLMRALV